MLVKANELSPKTPSSGVRTVIYSPLQQKEATRVVTTLSEVFGHPPPPSCHVKKGDCQVRLRTAEPAGAIANASKLNNPGKQSFDVAAGSSGSAIRELHEGPKNAPLQPEQDVQYVGMQHQRRSDSPIGDSGNPSLHHLSPLGAQRHRNNSDHGSTPNPVPTSALTALLADTFGSIQLSGAESDRLSHYAASSLRSARADERASWTDVRFSPYRYASVYNTNSFQDEELFMLKRVDTGRPPETAAPRVALPPSLPAAPLTHPQASGFEDSERKATTPLRTTGSPSRRSIASAPGSSSSVSTSQSCRDRRESKFRLDKAHSTWTPKVQKSTASVGISSTGSMSAKINRTGPALDLDPMSALRGRLFTSLGGAGR